MSIKNLNYIIWIAVCTVQILKSRKRIRYTPSVDNFDSKVKKTTEIDKPIEKIALVIIAIICVIPAVLILWFNRDELINPSFVRPEFAVYDAYAMILMGLALIIQDLGNIINFQEKIVIKIMQLLAFSLALVSSAMFLIYSSHIS